MPIEVNLAKLSPTMESGQLVKWLVKVGDTVKEGDTLAEIQTDKAVMPMEAFDEGTVARLDVQEGDEIALGQRVLLLAKKSEDFKQVGAQAASATPASSSAAAPTPLAAHAAATTVSGNGEQAHAPASAARPGGRVKSSPLAHKIAAAANVDLATVPGSGPAGRVVRNDVESFIKGGSSRSAAASGQPAPAREATRPSVAAKPGQTTRLAHSPMRKTIAKRMTESAQTVPVIHVTVDVRLDKVFAIREALNGRLAAEKVKLSVGDFVTKAAALALRKHPGLNASFTADAIVHHPDVNVGIAVALEGGLMVPVLHHADGLGLKDIRLGTEALATATRDGTLKPNQMIGGTFTISNLGMFGVKQFDAIINLPEVAILAVGAAEKRPVVEGNSLVVAHVMTVTLTADHRAVDGALAAQFVQTFKSLLEEPASMLL